MDTRERILDAAAAVMLERGIARATTKEIARAAGCSEPLLYRYFPDKQALLMHVLTERAAPLTGWEELGGRHTVTANLVTIVEALLAFYLRSFPIAASIFGDRQLLAVHRTRISEHGGGPHTPARAVQRYLDTEVGGGRLDAQTDTTTLARALAGSALFEAFTTSYDDHTFDSIPVLAERIVRVFSITGAGVE
jgi:AcrR family transcriptional regulator